MSRWDDKVITNRQIEYGCLDTFTSFKLGRVLRASSVDRVLDGWCVRIDKKKICTLIFLRPAEPVIVREEKKGKK